MSTVRSSKYDLYGKYDVKRVEGSFPVITHDIDVNQETGTFYVFTSKSDGASRRGVYVPADDIRSVEGFDIKNIVKKGGGKKMTKKAKRRANSTRRR